MNALRSTVAEAVWTCVIATAIGRTAGIMAHVAASYITGSPTMGEAVDIATTMGITSLLTFSGLERNLEESGIGKWETTVMVSMMALVGSEVYVRIFGMPDGAQKVVRIGAITVPLVVASVKVAINCLKGEARDLELDPANGLPVVGEL